MIAVALVAVSVHAEDWWDHYEPGVAAAQRGDWAATSSAMQKAIALKPAEEAQARAKSTILVYVPHFWLGLAKINLGDNAGGLKELAVSEQQGVIQQTRYMADLTAWKGRADGQQAKAASDLVAGDRKAAEVAINAALSSQVAAVSGGGGRSPSYISAQKSLKQAIEQFNRGGNDVKVFQQVAQTANGAKTLFEKAADEAKAAKDAAARPPAVDTDAPVLQVESEMSVNARIELQQLRRKLDESKSTRGADAQFNSFLQSSLAEVAQWDASIRKSTDDATASQVLASVNAKRQELEQRVALLGVMASLPKPEVAAGGEPVKPQALDSSNRARLRDAWTAFGRGDIAEAESILDDVIKKNGRLSQGYLLRGCVKYTRAMLVKDSSRQLALSASDFSTALALDGSLGLDTTRFSPKLLAFFGEVQSRMGSR